MNSELIFPKETTDFIFLDEVIPENDFVNFSFIVYVKLFREQNFQNYIHSVKLGFYKSEYDENNVRGWVSFILGIYFPNIITYQIFLVLKK